MLSGSAWATKHGQDNYDIERSRLDKIRQSVWLKIETEMSNSDWEHILSYG